MAAKKFKSPKSSSKGSGEKSGPGILYLIPISILLAGFLVAGAVYMGGGKDSVEGEAAKTDRTQADVEQESAGEQEDSGNPEVAGAEIVEIDTEGDPFWGAEDAPVTIVEFSQFTCPACLSYFTQAYDQIKSDYLDTGEVKYVFKDFTFQPNSTEAALAAACAGAQDVEGDSTNYFLMHDALFDNYEDWARTQDGEELLEKFVGYATDIGLDPAAFEECTVDEEYTEEIKQDTLDAQEIGAGGTPSIYVNGRKLQSWSLENFKGLIEEELEKAS